MSNLLKQRFNSLRSDKRFSEIFIGSAWSLAAQVLNTGMGLISAIIVARFYGAEMVGILAVINSFLTLAAILTVLGTDTSVLRLIPEHLVKYSPTSAFRLYRKTQYIVIGISLVIGSLFFYCSGLIADDIFSKPYLSFYFSLAAVFVVFKSLIQLNTQAVRGLRLIKVYVFMLVLPTLFNLFSLILLTVIIFSRNAPVYAQFASLAVTGIIGWVIMEYSFKRQMRSEDQVLPMSTRSILSISLPMLMTATISFLIGQTGVIMLGMFRSNAEVGYYSIAVKLATLTGFMLSAIGSMAAPKFSELFHSGNMEDLFYIAKKSAKLVFWTTTPILLCLVIFGKPLLGYAFGSEFVVAYPASVILIVGQFVSSISGSTGIFMNMTGGQNMFRNIMLGAAIITIPLNFILIPKFGIIGAAVSATVSLSFLNITILAYIKKNYGRTIGYLPIVWQK